MDGWSRTSDGCTELGLPGRLPASEAKLQRLRTVAPIDLPQSYIELLSRADGYEAGLSVRPSWLVLYPVNEVIEIATSGTLSEEFPNYFVIGGNGGGEAIAFDTRPENSGNVISFDMANIDLAESVMDVAANFDELLTKIDT